MRENMGKYRGKRIDNGEWVEGSLVALPDRAYIKAKNVGVAFGPAFNAAKGSYYCELVEVDPSTVGQYTGLSDKNGKEICEGDICKEYIKPLGSEYIGVTEYSAPSFVLNCKTAYGGHKNPFKKTDSMQDMQATIPIAYEYKKLGNIHDNPELLEVQCGK